MLEQFNITQSEKSAAKRAGKFYLKSLRTMGIFLLLGLILTAVTLVDADPKSRPMNLAVGESQEFTSFFAESGEDIQFSFVIEQRNGSNYRYEIGETNYYYDDHSGETYEYRETIDSPDELYKHMQDMPWYIQVQLQLSDDLSFEEYEVVKDVSGDVNIVNYEAFESGFYKLVVTNQDTVDLTVRVMKAEANMVLVALTIIAWILFGLSTAFFAISVHIGVWILVIFLIVKAISLINAENNREYPQVIGPEISN